MSSPDILQLEARGKAREVLRDAYLHDVRSLAVRLIDGFRSGVYVGPSGHGKFLSDFHSAIEGHSRVVAPQLILETICFSEERDAIHRAIAPELVRDRGWPEWHRSDMAVQPDNDHAYDDDIERDLFCMPPWEEIAYHALAQDVWRAVYDCMND